MFLATLTPNLTVFLKLGSTEGCQEFPATKMGNGGRVLLAVLNLYVPIRVRVATFDSNRSVADSLNQSLLQSRSFSFL